jgi:hypothetical protein
MVKFFQFPGAIPSRCVACTENLVYVYPRPQHYMDVSGQLQHLATSTLAKEQPVPTGQEAIPDGSNK